MQRDEREVDQRKCAVISRMCITGNADRPKRERRGQKDMLIYGVINSMYGPMISVKEEYFGDRTNILDNSFMTKEDIRQYTQVSTDRKY